ncbi:MAG: DUF2723 domain-containing protein [Bacteroidetes bacterium]|nr:DUF2723 domain-containing protein [Bacteroidota bacterium]
MNSRQKKIELSIGLSIGVISFLVYLFTLSPAVGFIDAGELAAAACTLGIAHPTGYPLFTLVGRIFSMLPVSSEEIIRLNIMAAFFVACGMVLFYHLLCELLFEYPQKIKILASVFSTVSLAFSQTVWSQATGIEVYSLHIFLIMLTLLWLLRAYRSNKFRDWLLFSSLWGLAFTNHLTSILIAPASLYLFIKANGLTKSSFKKIIFVTPAFFISLSLYIYLPIRSAHNPILNWGNPETAEKLFWHVSGKQFRVWMFSSTEAAGRQLSQYLHKLPQEFFYLPLLISLFGIVFLLIHNRKIFFWILLLLLTTVSYSINYDIHDIDSYFLLSYAAWMMFTAFGIVSLTEKLPNYAFNIFSIVILGFSVLTAAEHWKGADRSGEYLVEDYTKNVLAELPPNSILISYQWDYLISASYYFQYIKNFRPDIILIDKELLRRSWYFKQLNRNYPALYEKSKNEITLFLRELNKFEHDEPYEYAVIEGAYAEMMKSFVDTNIDSVRCFVTSEIEPPYLRGYYRIPYGLTAELRKDNSAYLERTLPAYTFHNITGTDTYTKNLLHLIVVSLTSRAAYEKQFNKEENERWFQQQAEEILH